MAGPGSHSPVGASAIKRVLACPASVALAVGIEDAESDHAALGTAVHSLIEECFRRNIDAWQLIGQQTVEGYLINKAMADGAQVFLNAVRAAHPDRNQSNFWVERRFHSPTIHPLFFGTSDCVALETMLVPPDGGSGDNELHIWDYKNGAGVVVEVEENEQGMYYACGALESLELWDRVERVVIHIVQPNAWHRDGQVREWETTADHLAEWLEDVCIPGIETATASLAAPSASSGEHCRFCPVRSHACPQLMADMDELEVLMNQIEKPGAAELTNEQLGRFMDLFKRAQMVDASANKTAFARMQNGAKIPGWKLVKKGANRFWKDTVGVGGAESGDVAEVSVEEAARFAFGAQAFTEPQLKSPAEIDKLPLGTAFTARAAAKPDVGLTIAKASDARMEVSVDTKSLFQPVVPTPAAPAPQVEVSSAPVKRRGAHLSVVV